MKRLPAPPQISPVSPCSVSRSPSSVNFYETACGGVAHVWIIRLDEELADHRLLDEAELQRASRFRFPLHRRRFVAGRAALRRLLGWWLGMPPREVELDYGERGKPFVSSDAVHQFNVSHSHDLAAIALSYGTPVGVDIERVRVLSDLDAISLTVFNERELAQLKPTQDPIQLRDFFLGWTRKEAYLKAVGTGLSAKLYAVTVDVGEHSPRLLSIEGPNETARWSLLNLFPRADFVGALAVRSPEIKMHIHERLPV